MGAFGGIAHTFVSKQNSNWTDEDTKIEIINKVDMNDAQGSEYDPDSIMHYNFNAAGLITAPSQFINSGIINHNPGLSAKDIRVAQALYGTEDKEVLLLNASESRSIDSQKPGAQSNFLIKPQKSRYYTIEAFGEGDGVMVLSELDAKGKKNYLTADDNGCKNERAQIRLKLLKGREYDLSYRLYHCSTPMGIMMW